MTRRLASTSRTPTSGQTLHWERAGRTYEKSCRRATTSFFITGKLRNFNQYVMGGFQAGEIIDAMTAYERFPEQRLHLRDDGQLAGNVIVDANGAQHPLDHHKQKTFDRRIKNYIVGTNEICMETPVEIALAREQTLEMLRELFGRNGTPKDIVGRFGCDLTDEQIFRLREWLQSMKRPN